jgi:hypothetical protein
MRRRATGLRASAAAADAQCPLPRPSPARRRVDCAGGSQDQDFVRALCDVYKKKTGKEADACAAARPSSAL